MRNRKLPSSIRTAGRHRRWYVRSDFGQCAPKQWQRISELQLASILAALAHALDGLPDVGGSTWEADYTV